MAGKQGGAAAKRAKGQGPNGDLSPKPVKAPKPRAPRQGAAGEGRAKAPRGRGRGRGKGAAGTPGTACHFPAVLESVLQHCHWVEAGLASCV